MCGIAGIVDTRGSAETPSLDLLKRMIGTLRHRGPDEFGVYRDDCAGLASARLSIVDLSTGQQPLSNEDRSLWIVYNGEIFNFVELRAELERLGHGFRTRSDTEVIVHAYESWGHECFARFNGQWALALWDSRNRRLILSRDRLGVRPLFVRQEGTRIWFASEVKAILADPAVPRAIDPRGIAQTFTYWASLAPTTVFEGIEELPPGSVWQYEPGKARTSRQYWTPTFPHGRSFNGSASDLSLDEATETLHAKLLNATTLRVLRADVPVGSYLSGGLDSSVIAWMGRLAKEGEFRTFSIRFEDAEFDETEFQRTLVAKLNSSHSEFVVRRRDIADIFPHVIRHTERPILRTAPAPMYLLSKLVRDSGIKAVLTGEGADEMLAGYDIFREAKIRAFWSRQPGSTARPRLFDRLYPYLARSPQLTKDLSRGFWGRGLSRYGTPGFSHEPRWSTTSSLRRFFSREINRRLETNPMPDVLETLPEDFALWDDLARAQYLETSTLFSPYIISSQGDRMLMANSVEGRFPFLDRDVVEFCNGLPALYKLPGLNEKNILKRMARGFIPRIIVERKKQPYRAPDAVCFVEPGAPAFVEELLSPEAIARAGLFEPSKVSALVDKCRSGSSGTDAGGLYSNTDNMAFVGILSAQLLHHEFIRSHDAAHGADLPLKTYINRVHTTQTYEPQP